MDWVTISALATAGGTLILALATFASVRSANRAARAAERSLLAGLRPVLMSSRLQDLPQKVSFFDQHWVTVEGGHAAFEVSEQAKGAFRDPNEPIFATARDAAEARQAVTVDLLYGDHQGGQRMISRFALAPVPNGAWLATVGRHWNLDRADPR